MSAAALIPRRGAIIIVRLYQTFLSPLFPTSCRFDPSCSQYAVDSFNKYGLLRGALKSAWRVLRCNPWGGSGNDPA